MAIGTPRTLERLEELFTAAQRRRACDRRRDHGARSRRAAIAA